jgi:hypothetical protein
VPPVVGSEGVDPVSDGLFAAGSVVVSPVGSAFVGVVPESAGLSGLLVSVASVVFDGSVFDGAVPESVGLSGLVVSVASVVLDGFDGVVPESVGLSGLVEPVASVVLEGSAPESVGLSGLVAPVVSVVSDGFAAVVPESVGLSGLLVSVASVVFDGSDFDGVVPESVGLSGLLESVESFLDGSVLDGVVPESVGLSGLLLLLLSVAVSVSVLEGSVFDGVVPESVGLSDVPGPAVEVASPPLVSVVVSVWVPDGEGSALEGGDLVPESAGSSACTPLGRVELPTPESVGVGPAPVSVGGLLSLSNATFPFSMAAMATRAAAWPGVNSSPNVMAGDDACAPLSSSAAVAFPMYPPSSRDPANSWMHETNADASALEDAHDSTPDSSADTRVGSLSREPPVQFPTRC